MITDAVPGVSHLDAHECWGLLRACAVGRIAFTRPDGPDVVPVNVVVDHGAVVLRVGASSALAAVARSSPPSSRVALEADGVDLRTGQAWSVVLRGPLALLRTMDDLVSTVALPLFPWHAEPKPLFLRLVPSEVTGRRFAVVTPGHWDAPLRG